MRKKKMFVVSNKTVQARYLAAFILVIALTHTGAFAQSVCFNYKGSWSSWKKLDIPYNGMSYAIPHGSGCTFETIGKIDFFEFKIKDYVPPSKKEIKAHRKSGEWFEYTGTVSYYVSDDYPTAEALAKACVFVTPNPRKDITPVVKRTTSAIIIIAPYKKNPACYNVWFDNIGVGISVQGLRLIDGTKLW